MKKQTPKPPRTLWICLGIALVTLAVLSPLLGHEFLGYDDQLYVSENPHVQAGLTWQGLVWAFRGAHASNWHPLTWLSHMLDCQIYGLKAAGHHLTNLLLHVASTLVLFLALNRMTGLVWRSAAVAALFAWHPLHVESVAWVAERKDVLSALFWMLALYSYVLYAAKPAASRYLATLGLFVLGLLSKPMVVTLPFVLLLLDFWPLGRISDLKQFQTQHVPRQVLIRLILEKLPFLLLAAVSCALTVWAQQRGHAIVSAQQLTIGERVGHALVSYLHYVVVMFIPRHLAVFYPYPASTPVAEIAIAALLLALVSAAVLCLARCRPYLLVGWLWFLGTLVPVIGLVQVGDQAWADRYTYLPLIGLFILLVWGAFDFAGDGFAVRVVTVFVGLGLLTETFLQLSYWQNTQTLFEHADQVTHGNYLAATLLGSMRAKEGRLDEAMGFYSRALRYKPDYPQAHFFVGHALEEQGKLDEAMTEYADTVRLDPHFEPAHIFLGAALAKQKRYDEAVAHYQAALQIDPESVVAQNNLGKVLQMQGRLDEAIARYTEALRIDPNFAMAHNNLGVILLQKGRLAEGIAQLREALRLNPGDLETSCNLAQALNQLGEWNGAAEILSRIVPSQPNNPNLHYQFGLALAQQGKTREAMSHYARALLLEPDFPEALDGLSWVLAADPRPEFRNGTEAVRMAERACELTGQKQALLLATLAAAYGEAGRYNEGISTVRKAQHLAASAGQNEVVARCQAILKSLESNEAYRETTPAKGVP